MTYLKNNIEFIKELASTCLILAIITWIIVNISTAYHLPKHLWKCTHADIINNDPSNTECTNYKKIKPEEKE